MWINQLHPIQMHPKKDKYMICRMYGALNEVHVPLLLESQDDLNK